MNIERQQITIVMMALAVMRARLNRIPASSQLREHQRDWLATMDDLYDKIEDYLNKH